MKGERKDLEPRDLPRVPEDLRDGMDSGSGKEDAVSGWLESGAEDPAFFIKPSDED